MHEVYDKKNNRMFTKFLQSYKKQTAYNFLNISEF